MNDMLKDFSRRARSSSRIRLPILNDDIQELDPSFVTMEEPPSPPPLPPTPVVR